jgi:hypothetical protein
MDREPDFYGLTELLERLHAAIPTPVMAALRRVVLGLLWVSIVTLVWLWRPAVGAVLAANTVGILLLYIWRRLNGPKDG